MDYAFILMSASITAPNPCLIAILLICQTRSESGPQLVFHWPPNPLQQARENAEQHTEEESDASSQDSDSWSSEHDDFGSTSDNEDHLSTDHDSKGQASRSGKKVGQTYNESDENHKQQRTLFGYDEDGIVSLLTPDRSWHKRKFELSLNDLTFVGRPVFSKPDGSWRKHRKPRNKHAPPVLSELEQTTDDEKNGDVTPDQHLDVQAQSKPAKSELTMFHPVFVMNPPPLDHTRRVKDMYDNVVRKFARALKFLQTQQDYVWEQVEILLAKRHHLLKDAAHDTSVSMQDLLNTSLLSAAIATIFNAISTSKIASVQLISGIQLPLQIPPVTSSSYLPALTESPIPPGLWLTTATEAAMNADTAERLAPSTTLELAKTYTLLLKSAPEKIARDAQTAGGPLADHLPRFVAALRPTKSFWKLSQQHKISLADIQLLSRHLIYWRRAVMIPPLHQRDTYIVSPNADFSKLDAACKSYQEQFPASLPSLPKLLSVLSGIPRPYGTLIPSHDHKETYMFLLAWLLRNGLVTQLRTYAYIRVDASAKRRALERDRTTRASIAASMAGAEQNPANTEDTSVTANTRPSFVSRASSDERQSIRDNKNSKFASLIKNPTRATPEESSWINCIHHDMLDEHGVFSQLTEDERQELYHNWESFSKHFDGNAALESIPVKEGVKRTVAWNIFGKLGLSFDGGVEKDGENKALLVTVRHW